MNWIKLFHDYNINHKATGNRVLINCPHHSPKDIDYFMRVYESGACSCWYCGGNSGISTISLLLGISPSEAWEISKRYSEGKTYTEGHTHTQGHTSVALQNIQRKLTPVELKYLHSRGVTDEQIALHNLQGGGIAGYFKYRVVIPIYNASGVLISARGRDYTNNPVRYLAMNPKDELQPHKQTLYMEHLLHGDTVAVVEGEFDSIAGGVGFVATYGTNVSNEQIIALSKYKRVLMCFDNDSAGQRAVDKVGNAIAILSNTHVESILIESKYKSMGDIDPGMIKEINKELFSV